MSYFPPFIDATGFNIPTYTDIFNYLLQQYALINGQSVTANVSTSDVQSISIFALMINDAFQSTQLAINGMGAATAIGVQQDALYKINGIARNPATRSTATVTITGDPGTELIGRLGQDANGNLWSLPPDFFIPISGTIDVAATCNTMGVISAAIGAISIPFNPTAGWTGITNAASAIPGTPAEADSAFRARQALSVALPSQSLVVGTLAAIGATLGVTRYGIIGVENPTGGVDSYGNPAHSISMVVEGGTNLDIATAIYLNKTPGCLTNGTTTVNVVDPVTGSTMPIKFFRPTYDNIAVAITVTPLAGYTTATNAAIKTALVNYLNSLQIGEGLTISALYGAALAVMPNLSLPMFSITALTAGIVGGSLASTDIAIAFNHVVSGSAVNITVTD